MPSLILSKPIPFDFMAVAQVLSRAQKIPSIDAVHQVKQKWGVLSESIPEEQGRALQKIFSASGFETILIEALLPKVPSPQALASVKWEAAGALCSLKGVPAMMELTPSSISLLAACIFQEDHIVKLTHKEGPSTGQRLASAGILLATGIPVRIGPKSKTVETKKNVPETVYYLDIYKNDAGTLKHFRIVGDQFDYSCLGAKKQYNITANFKALLKEWVAYAPQARQGRGTSILLQDKPIADMGYRSLDDLDQESRWLLSLPK
jgi:hypothetical protein